MRLNFTLEQNADFHFGHDLEVAQPKMAHSHDRSIFVGKNIYGCD